MTNIKIDINYDIKKDEFDVSTNAKDPKDLVTEYLRTQISSGTDRTESTKPDVYSIAIELDLSGDIFTVSHNCGNKGLRDGILMHYTQQEG